MTSHVGVAWRLLTRPFAMESDLLDQVEKVIYQLYENPTASNVSTADKWLSALQDSQEAWSLSWQLLGRPCMEVQNFGALVLKNKLLKSWRSDIGANQLEPLRYELFQAILKFSNGPKVVLTQLCVAMTMYAFHVVPTNWPNFIASIIETLAANNLAALLELLKVLPEEFEETGSNVFASKRSLIRQEIKNGQGAVFAFLEQIISSDYPSNIKLSTLKCLGSWTSFMPSLPQLHSLIDLLFQMITEPTYISEAIDVLNNIVTKEDNYKYSDALKNIQLQVNHLTDYIQDQLDSADKDMVICSSLCSLVTEILTSNINSFVEISEESADNSEVLIESLTLLLRFTTLPGHYPVDEKCSEISIAFWDKFLNILESQETSHCRFLLEFYQGILISLIEMFPVKAQFPSDEDWTSHWNEDEQDDFMKYRDDLWELGDSLQQTLHYPYVQHLSLSLSKLLSQPSSSVNWQEVEAILYLLQGAAGNVTEHTSIFFHNVLAHYHQMPSHNTLAKSALRLLGSLSEWFQYQPNALSAALPMILDGISKPSLAASSALAFRDICSECHTSLVPALSNIVTSCQEALSNPQVPFEHSSILVAAVCSVLSSLSLSSLSEPLEFLLNSIIQNLQSLASQQPSLSIYPMIKKELTILNAFSSHLVPKLAAGEQHPVLSILLKVWPSLKTLLLNWIGDADIVGIISAILLRAIHAVGFQYYPLLPDTLHIIFQCFSSVQHPKLLDTASKVVESFGQHNQCQDMLVTFLRQLLELCFQLCHHGLQTMDPDILKALLELLKKVLETCPGLLLGIEGTIDTTYTIGLASLQLPEQSSMISASNLMAAIVKLADSLQPIGDLLLARGEKLVEVLLRCIGGSIDRSRLGHLVVIFSSLTIHCLTELSNWLQTLLSKDGFPTQCAMPLEKQMFRQSILRERGNDKNLKLKINEFSLICRGFHGTLYAAETSRSLP